MDILTQLANWYQSDKGSTFFHRHEFSKIYNSIFYESRDKIRSILEIGVFNGASIRMWREYFPNAIIYGFDNDISKIDTVNDLQNVHTFLVDQSDRKSLLDGIERTGCDQFDIIIDDGSHMMNHQQITFGTLFPYLKSNGQFIIEDLHTSLNKNIIDTEGYDTTTLFMFKQYEDTGMFNSIHMTTDELNYINNNVLTAEVYGRENIHVRPSGMSITSIITKK
jgi:hypothetical protein